MDWLTFICSIVASVAWPATLLVAVLLVRKEVWARIPVLRELQAKGMRAVFAEEVKHVEAQLQVISAPAAAPENPARERLIKFAERSPSGAVIEAWKLVEMRLVQLAIHHSVRLRSEAEFQPISIAHRLANMFIIPVEVIASIGDLQALRNRVAHSQDGGIDTANAVMFVQSVMELLVRVPLPEAPGGGGAGDKQ
jgi:hypothetical protein